MTVGLRERHQWLSKLPVAVSRIADFGYWSGGEPFALLWTLDASEITVIEKSEENIAKLSEEIEYVSHRHPESLRDRVIYFYCRDMTEEISELADQYHDLAFCENVLYNLQREKDQLDRAISQMIRTTKMGGIIVAIEPKFGVSFELQEIEFLGKKMPMPVPLNEPGDMNGAFVSKGLERMEVKGLPAFAYCYQRIR